MPDVVYKVVEHDGGWAYTLGGAFSETFRSRGLAEAAASRVAEEQRTPGETEAISWQDESGDWHDELESGSDRPNATVEGLPSSPARRPIEDRPALAAGRMVGARRDGISLLSIVLVAVFGFLIAMTLGRSGHRG